MRSVLIYVDDKKSAFDEFFRVLRPGGRLSLFEPINRFAQTGGDTWLGYDVTAVGEAARKVRSFYEAIQPPDSDPMFAFDERDLVDLVRKAGFFPIHLQLESAIEPPLLRSWTLSPACRRIHGFRHWQTRWSRYSTRRREHDSSHTCGRASRKDAASRARVSPS